MLVTLANRAGTIELLDPRPPTFIPWPEPGSGRILADSAGVIEWWGPFPTLKRWSALGVTGAGLSGQTINGYAWMLPPWADSVRFRYRAQGFLPRAYQRCEKIEDATLYLADCLDVLPMLPADCVITDPVWPNCPAGLLFGHENPRELWARAAALMDTKRLVVIMRHDSDPAMLAGNVCGLDFFRICVLPYVMPGYIGRKLGGDELAYCYGKPVKSQPGRRVIPGNGPKVMPAERERNGHPCSRSLRHMKFLVQWFSDEGDLVLDPFMGSGTIGVACRQLGRRFVGVEKDPKYFDIACRQIEQATKQGDLFLCG